MHIGDESIFTKFCVNLHTIKFIFLTFHKKIPTISGKSYPNYGSSQMDQPNYPLTGTKLTDPKKYWPGQVARTDLGLLRFSDVRNHLLNRVSTNHYFIT